MTTSWAERRRSAAEVAADHDGVLSRAQLRLLGTDRDAVAREVAADRWRPVGTRSVALHKGPISDPARWRIALWEVDEENAALDGVSALLAAGAKNLTEGAVHISVPHGTHLRKVDGVRQHRVRRQPDEVLRAGIARVRPAVAAIRAASWAVSDRQAALFLVLPVQQRLVTPQQLVTAVDDAHVRDRRGLIRRLLLDIADGAQSLGELDFARLCRRYGLPEPDRQVVRRTPKGRIYLDVRWSDCDLVVEIDGSGHRQGLAVSDDNLRQNWVTLQGGRVLRIDLIGLRLLEAAFMRQVLEAYRQLAPHSRPW